MSKKMPRNLELINGELQAVLDSRSERRRHHWQLADRGSLAD